MSWQLSILILGSILIILFIMMYFSVRLSRRRLKKSKYGHTFDFSQMPSQKITSSKKAG